MRRKLTICLIVILCCLNLSGCALGAIKTQVQNCLSGAQTKDFKNGVAEDNLFAMSKKTKAAQQAALNAQDKADELNDRAANTTWVGKLWPGNWFLKTRANSATIKANKATNQYETAKATDETWLKARESAGKTGVNAKFAWTKFSWLIALAILILILVLWSFLKHRKRQDKAAIKAAKHADTVVIDQPAASTAKLVDRNEEKAAISCKKYCSKYGIDYDTYLAQYGGDNKALLDFLISSSADDFK